MSMQLHSDTLSVLSSKLWSWRHVNFHAMSKRKRQDLLSDKSSSGGTVIPFTDS
eukprot:m.123101 g.123101  ORF g.123101 m.123101 type:complete len:54 (+) comp37812_c0_seq29:3744-3905(+)